MKEVLKKMAAAKEHVKTTKLKKDGWNDFSKYAYFTPAQIDRIVSDACTDNGLMTAFNLKRNEHGETGFLTVYDLDSLESIVYEMATGIPEIKATNLAQQLGGCVTYTERYLKMSAFGVVDNSLDFDTTENTRKVEQQKAQPDVKKTPEKTTDFAKLDDAILQINKAANREELTRIWNANKEFQKMERFINAATDAGKKFKA